MSARWTGTPGVRVEPSSFTQECLTAIGSKKMAAEVIDARISCEARRDGSIILRGGGQGLAYYLVGGAVLIYATSPTKHC